MIAPLSTALAFLCAHYQVIGINILAAALQFAAMFVAFYAGKRAGRREPSNAAGENSLLRAENARLRELVDELQTANEVLRDPSLNEPQPSVNDRLEAIVDRVTNDDVRLDDHDSRLDALDFAVNRLIKIGAMAKDVMDEHSELMQRLADGPKKPTKPKAAKAKAKKVAR